MARVNTQKLTISNKIFAAWQDLLELFSQLSDTPVAMITRLHHNKIKVFCTNHGVYSPYRVDDEFLLGSHHFCETTLKNDSILVVKDAAKDPTWSTTAAVNQKQISAYLGIPINWPNGTQFGTLSLLDTKINEFCISTRELMAVFKDTVEAELTVIYQNEKLQQFNQDLRSRVHTRTVELASLSYQLEQETNKRKLIEQECHFQRYHDTQTHLLNAKAWESKTHKMVEQANLEQQQIIVFYLTLSNATRIQAEMGTETVDFLIKQISDNIGVLDVSKQLVARPSQNEIALTLLCSKENNANKFVLQRLIDVTSREFSTPSGKVRLQVFIGVSISDVYCTHKNRQLIAQAYQAMWSAQESDTKVYYFDRNVIDTDPALNTLESYFMTAIQDNALQVLFQPQIELKSGLWSGASTIINWDHPTMGNVSQLTIKQLCDHPKLADALSQFIISKALVVCAKWRNFIPKFRISVTLNSCQLAANNLPNLIELWLEKNNLTGDALEIEISERLFIANEAVLTPNLEKLNQLGVTLSLSEFCLGHVSFSHLKMTPFKRLKIDKSFMNNWHNSDDEQRSLGSLIQIIEKVGLDTVVTGVRTDTQEAWLLQFQNPYVEGSHYFGPLTHNQFGQELIKKIN